MSRRPDPQFVTFDMYGTLTDFPVGAAAEKTIEAISSPGQRDVFRRRFAAYQLDESMGDWRPYDD